MRLIPDWRKVLRHAWSVRLMALAAVLNGGVAAFPFVAGMFPPTTAALVSFALVAGAGVARFIPQQKVSGGDDAE